MKLFIAIMCFMLMACSHPVVIKHHGLKGGVKEPVYPPEGPVNCWIQPPHDDLWYPCQDSDGLHIH